MQFYSQFPARRTRQVIADIVALAGIVLSVVIGVGAARALLTFGGFGRDIEGAGTQLQDSLAGAAETLGGIPLVGSRAESTLLDASTVGEVLAQAGRDQQHFVTVTAVVAGIVIAAIPIALIARLWLVGRIRYTRSAEQTRALARLPAGMDLLALRALGTRPAAQLLGIATDPVAAWRRGDSDVVEALAELELRESGLRRL